MNAMEWNRDLTRPIQAIRQREHGLGDKPDRGRGTVCFPEMRRGAVGLCVATQIARYVKPTNPLPGWDSPAQAWAQTQGQLAWYQAMEETRQMVRITERAGLEKHLELWRSWLARKQEPGDANAAHPDTAPGVRPSPGAAATERASALECLTAALAADVAAPEDGRTPVRPPTVGAASGCAHANAQQTADSVLDQPAIGYVLSLEGADSLLSVQHVERAYAQGLRAIGPAHYGPGTYAQGTDASGGLGTKGRQLLKAMQQLGIILDVTHLCDESFWEAVDLFPGPVWASHSNCRALVPHPRQLSDEQIKCLIQRGAVIGIALDAWMLVPVWVRGQTTPQATGLTLERFVDHVNHICQVAGSALHVGIGSDLDGGFGREQTPVDLDTIADLARLPGMLRARGYGDDDIDQIRRGNFIRLLREAWPGRPP